MNFKKLLLFLVAPLAMMISSCTPDGPEYTMPTIKVTNAEGVEINTINFDAEGGNQTFVITSTRSWEITNQAEWLAVNPLKYTNTELTETSTTITLTAPANDGAARTEVLKVKMENKEITVTIAQKDAEGNIAAPNGATPITVAEFLAKEQGDDTVYQLTGTIGGSINTQYGNFDLTDATGTVYIYGLKGADGKTIDWNATGLNKDDVITVQGKYYLYEKEGADPKVEMKDALYISHEDAIPVLKEGPYASDAAFVVDSDNGSVGQYSLGDTQIDGKAVTGFKLGKSGMEGKFTSQKLGVSGSKYLNFYGVAWKGTSATLYYRVDGGEVKSQALNANAGATGNAPYPLTATAADHYSIQLTGLTENSTIEFGTNENFANTTYESGAPRVIVFGVKLSDSPIEAVEGGSTGGGTTDQPSGEAPTDLIEVTIEEFNAAPVSNNTWYKLTGEIINIAKKDYGNFTIKDATGEVYIYGMTNGWVGSNNQSFSQIGLNVGDTVTLGTLRGEYNGQIQGGGNPVPAFYISHVAGEGGEEPEPEQPAVPGAYTSDAAFVCSDDSTPNASYSLKDTKIGGEAVSGVKLGTGSLAGVFASQAVGVEGTKELSFYAVAWKGKKATLYVRVDGGEATSMELASHDGATGNPPFAALTARESDHYTVTLNNLTASSVVEFSTDASFTAASNSSSGRAVIFGIKLGEGSGDNGGETPEPEDPETPEEPENPEPEEPETPAEPEVATIASILALGQNATIESAVVEGVVISNMSLNNLTSKKGMYIQDATAGLQFYFAANHEFNFGDKVKVDLSGAKIGAYNGAVQISGLALDKVTLVSTGNAVEAKTVAMADFLANKYEGQYVALDGVQVAAADLSKTWVMGGAHTSINMEDAEGNTFVVFSSKYATYGTETVAQGSGTLKGIAAINNGTVQIIFGQQSDYAGLTGERFGATEEPETPTDPETPTEPETPEGGESGDEVVTKTAVFNWANGYANETTVITVEDITFTGSLGTHSNTPARIWNNQLRTYAGNTITFSAAEGYVITSISGIAALNFTGSQQTVEFTNLAKNTYSDKVTVTYQAK